MLKLTIGLLAGTAGAGLCLVNANPLTNAALVFALLTPVGPETSVLAAAITYFAGDILSSIKETGDRKHSALTCLLDTKGIVLKEMLGAKVIGLAVSVVLSATMAIMPGAFTIGLMVSAAVAAAAVYAIRRPEDAQAVLFYPIAGLSLMAIGLSLGISMPTAFVVTGLLFIPNMLP